MKRLIITADDFGASREVNEAVEAAHRDGILSAASLMVSAPAAADAVARARRMPGLRVGLHLVLVEGAPLLPAAELTRLVDRRGQLRSDMAALGALLSVSRRARRQLAAEIGAQFEAFRATGLALDHCNAHKHFQLHPVVGDLMASIGRGFGLRAARAPLEPLDVLRRIEPRTSRAEALVTVPFARFLRRRLRAAGLLTADRTFGIRWSGRMTRGRLRTLIAHLPEGLSEIYLHPAVGPYAGCVPEYLYREELDALTAPDVLAACRDGGIERGGFADFEDLIRRRPAHRAAGTHPAVGSAHPPIGAAHSAIGAAKVAIGAGPSAVESGGAT
ncbi:MAG TPA: hopanoid biosynthesis-associated protein HpnK [Steroidobacteraceae bacterium]|nr:hopanoid biosynthesis-associated protein HpnK [Steroidobacteraceae bacterium]